MTLQDKRPWLKKIAEDLIAGAFMDGFCIGCPTSHIVQNRPYTEWPERCKPGGLIKSKSEKERRSIKLLKSEHFNDRQK